MLEFVGALDNQEIEIAVASVLRGHMDPVQLIAVPLEGIREDLVALRHLQEAALRVVIDRTLAVGGSPALGRNRSGLFLVVESLDLLVAELVPAGSVPLENPSATGGIGASSGNDRVIVL